MTSSWVLLAVSLVVILIGCDLFTNGVEWLGKKLSLGEGVVGSVLAAVGTCMPETLIAILAIVFGEKSGVGDDIGIGAILGAPLMLSTLAFCLTGAAVLVFSVTKRRTAKMRVDHRILGRDLRFFFIVFSLAAVASYLPGKPYKAAVALVLVGLYGLYVRQTFADKRGPESDEDISPLHFKRSSADPPLWLVISQSALGVAILVYGAHLFVKELVFVAAATGIRPLILSLIITPVATELPEKINSIIWVRQKKDTLALGNISGAMVFQSSISPAIGMVLTDWKLDNQALAVIVVALGSAAAVWGSMLWKKRLSPYVLLMGGVFYAGYLWWVIGRSGAVGFN
jgi:cation:H+ antiporter